MLTKEKQIEIIESHPDVTKVLLRAEPRASSITTTGKTDIAPLLAHIGLVVTKTRRPRHEDKRTKTLWPTWYQVRHAPPGSQAISLDLLLALVCTEILELTQAGGKPASITDAGRVDVDVTSVWGNRYTLHKVAKNMYLLRATPLTDPPGKGKD